MKKSSEPKLSRREREIMNVVYQLGDVTVHDVVEQLADQPAYDSIRVTLGILQKKGHLERRREGRQYVYFSKVPVDTAARSAARNVMNTFFGGSPSRAILTFLDVSAENISADEIEEIEKLIEERKQK